MKPEELAVGRGFEKGLKGYGPFSWYMRWYLRRRPAVEAPAVLAQLGERRFARFLDVGCGTGIWLADLYRRGHGRERLAGIDVSELMTAEARARLSAEVGNDSEWRVEQGSAAELPFSDASFDAVMSNGMVKHLDDERLARFLAEARRVLAPGGRISVWDFGRLLLPLGNVQPANPALRTDHLRTSEELMKALTEAGFTHARPYRLKRPWRLPVTLEGATATRE